MASEEVMDALVNAIELADGHNHSMVHYFCLIDLNGHYQTTSRRNCHPLETVVLGEKIEDCINVQVAKTLGVSLSWVEGFIDGYDQSGVETLYKTLSENDLSRVRYIDGFRVGKKIKFWISDGFKK